MAEPTYFPSLDKCLGNEERLLSWQTAYDVLCDLPTALRSYALESFFFATEALYALDHPSDPFASASPASKARFETKTAPIHVSQSTTGQYNLSELKKDALWLSEQVKIDEEAALRIAIVEWQQRDIDQVLLLGQQFQSAVNSADALGASIFAETPATGAGIESRTTAPALDFAAEGIRRARLLRTYLDEKLAILKVSADLIGRHASAAEDVDDVISPWIDRLAKRIASGPPSNLSEHETNKFQRTAIANAVAATRTCFEHLDDRQKWPTVFIGEPDAGEVYVSFMLLSLIETLRIALARINLLDTIGEASTFQSWFTLMGDVNFAQYLTGTATIPNIEILQHLVAAVSLAMVQLPYALEAVAKIASAASSEQRDRPAQYPFLNDEGVYLNNMACLQTIGKALCEAVRHGVVVAASTLYAWSLLTIRIRNAAAVVSSTREAQLLQHEDGPDPSMAGRRDSDTAPETEIEKRWDWICDPSLEEARSDPARFFIVTAVDNMNVYDAVAATNTALTAAYGADATVSTTRLWRQSEFDLIREGLDAVGYEGSSVDALLGLLAPITPFHDRDSFSEFARKFMTDEARLRPGILNEALLRYPYELVPLVRLCASLAAGEGDISESRISTIVQTLEDMSTVTLMVPENFRSYTLESEDENTNAIYLTAELQIFNIRRTTLPGENKVLYNYIASAAEHEGPRNVMIIPAGTPGIVVKEDRPMVLSLTHRHSALEYFGLALSTLLPSSPVVPAHPSADVDRSTVAEIINLLTGLLRSTLKRDESREEARFVLGRFGFALHGETDIIAVVGDIFEAELLSHLNQESQSGSLDLCIACADFFVELTAISPERVWSFLGRSSLLGILSGTSSLAAVVSSAEAQLNQYRFLVSCAKMHNVCVQDAAAGLLVRKSRPRRINNSRFDTETLGSNMTPERTIATVLTAFTRMALDVSQSLASWRFADGQEKTAVLVSIVEAFGTLLRWTYDLQPSTETNANVTPPQPRKKEQLAKLLSPAADMVAQALARDSAMLDSLTQSFNQARAISDTLVPLVAKEALIQQIKAVCQFLATALRIWRFIDPTKAHSIASHLLHSVPNVAMCFVSSPYCQSEIADYLAELTTSLACTDDNPPSLLSRMSTEVAKPFMNAIAQLDRPVSDLDAECAIWRFLTAVLESRQQWFSMFLLTGVLPKDRMKSTTSATEGAGGKSLLSFALDELVHIVTVVPIRAVVMLRFVAAAQSAWIWATVTVRSHTDFLKSTLDWLHNLAPPPRSAKDHIVVVSAWQYRAAAYLCDLLAVNLHTTLEVGNKDLLKALLPKLGFLSKHACAVDGYNRSLHRNLADNMSRRFSGIDLEQFRRRDTGASEYGAHFAYDTDFAEQVLGHEVNAWGSIHGLKPKGYAAEVMRANINLSLVDAERHLLRSWTALASTLSHCVNEEAVHEPLIETVQVCLRANESANLDDPNAADVLLTRADLAFIVLSKLVEAHSAKEGMREMLSLAWTLVIKSPVDYGVATATEDLAYYRTLLQVLFLAIRPHGYLPLQPLKQSVSMNSASVPKPALSTEVAITCVEIITRLVAPGFRSLCGNLYSTGDAQTSVQLALPTDFALMIALLRSVLAVNGIQIAYQPVADAITNSGMVRAALSLYTWSDQLAEVMDHDPVYGEVAVNTLGTLSTVPHVAEQMALDGVLLQLASANLSNYFRKPGGKGQWDEPVRMFAIWTEGFLPLCLNLLDGVGPAIAGEVVAFLNSFPEQLSRAESAFSDGPTYPRRRLHSGDVSLTLVREMHALVLIGLTLQSDIARAAAEGLDAADIAPFKYDLEVAKAEVQKLARTQRSLADKVVPTNEREMVWASTATAGPYDNELQRRVFAEVHKVLALFGESAGGT